MQPGGHTEPLFAAGTIVGHFRVGRLLGRGGMAEVYLARDLELGRRVALKIVLPELIGDEQAVPRLLSEARITAQFSHPHIVTIYEVGEHDGCPYIALEYLEGHTLKQRMAVDPPHLKEQLRIALAIAQALHAAHEAQVLHRDLKPQNVIIPKDGRLRVLDFGLAKVMQRDGSPADQPNKRTGTGTPAYMSPERWRGKACTAAADIWSLGIMLYELVTDRRPFAAASFDAYVKEVVSAAPVAKLDPSFEVPTEYGELIAQCLDKSPARRPTAAQVADELEAMLQLGRRRPGSDPRSPFRGLLPFSERHSDLFYGRDAEIPAFLERLRDEVVLPVVGPSGAGKSSFVQAGVIPRLRELGLWSVLQLRPGTDPFRALAGKLLWEHSPNATRSDTQPTVKVGSKQEALARRAGTSEVLAEGEDELAARLYDSPRQLNLILHDLAEALGCRLLLFVDQLEELHTLRADRADQDDVARRFMEALCTAADDPREPVRIVFALRDDFLIRLAQGPEALSALSRVTVVRTPERHHLEEILLKPLERVGFRYDDAQLTSEMVAAVRDEPACLPLLQFTAHLLWERRDQSGRLLRRADYDALGGVAGALARHADGVLDQLSAAQTAAARTILLRLVTPERTRRVCTRSTVLEGLGDEAAEVVDRLVTARLVSVRSGRGEQEDDSELEIVHESLLKTWQRLTQWIDDSREELAFVAEVSPTAELWDKRGRRDEELWDGDALTEALWMLERVGARAPERVTAFLAAGRAKQQRALRRRRGLIVGAIVLLSLVALTLAAQNREVGRQRDQAEAERQTANEERHRTRLRWAEAQREGALAALLGGDPLVARAKLRGSLEQQDSPLARALWWRLDREPLRWKRDLGSVVQHVAVSPDGTTVAAGCQDKTIALLDVDTGAARFLRGHADQVLAVAYSPDGVSLASVSWSGELMVWNLASATKTLLHKGPSQLRTVAYSPDGRLLATAGADKTIRVWEPATKKLVQSLAGHGAAVRTLRFSPDGTLLASGGDDKTVRLWAVSTWRERQVLTGHEGGVYTVAFSPDGQALASGGTDQVIRIWRVGQTAAPRRIAGANATVASLAYTPDGKTLVGADFGKHVRIWDSQSAAQRNALTGHDAGILSLSLGPAGALVATASWDNTVRLWDLRVSAEAQGMAGHAGGVYGVAFNADGSTLASGSLDRTIGLWDVATGTRRRVLTGHRNSVSGLDVSPDGQLLASASGDHTIAFWNLATGVQKGLLIGHQAEVTDIRFSPDGQRLLSGSYDKTARLWDTVAGTESVRYPPHEGPVWGVAISGDGHRAATSSDDKTVRVWDLTGHHREPTKTLREHPESVTAVAFHPDDSNRLATGCDDHKVRLWDLETGKHRDVGTHAGRVYWLAFSPDGQTIGAPDSSGAAILWHLDTGSHSVLSGHRGEVNFLRFSRDGELVATGGDDGTVRLWRAKDGRPHWRAPVLLTSPPELLTHRGWIRFDGKQAKHEETAWRTALETDARTADHHRGGTICLVRHDGRLQLWDRTTDRMLRWWPDLAEATVHALDEGCVTLADGELRLHEVDGTRRQLGDPCSAVALDGDQLVASCLDEIIVFDAQGAKVTSYPAVVGVTALALGGGRLLVGYANGNLEGLVADGTARPPLSFQDTPASPVVRMVLGPMDTLVVGYASGALGLWSLTDGARLHLTRLHGPVVHLLLSGHQLIAATELGSHHAFDLSAFHLSYCDLLERAWQAIPVVWESARPVSRGRPSDHLCRAR